MSLKFFISLLFFILITLSCDSSERTEEIILNSVNQEWVLQNVVIKGKQIKANENQKIYIVFNKNGRYNMYWKKNGKRIQDTFTDNIIIPNWFVDSTNTLYINDFKGMKLILLTKSKLIFLHKKIRYEFNLLKN